MKRLIRKNVESAKQVGVLYHYTGLFNANNILAENTLRAADFVDEQGNTSISLTRNKNFHNNNVQTLEDNSMECRFVIDGDRLSNNYKIEPYDYYPDYPRVNEQEERIVYKKQDEEDEGIAEVSPIIPYIISLDIFKENFEEIINPEDPPLWLDEVQYCIDFDINSLEDLINYMESKHGIKVNLI